MTDMTGQIFAHFTATAVLWHGEDSDDYTDTHGWVNEVGDMELEESRNYVTPAVNVPDTDDELSELVKDTLSTLGHYEDNGDGTFYGTDETTDYDSGTVYTYALHFTRKTFEPRGGVWEWREDSWHPESDGGISLTHPCGCPLDVVTSYLSGNREQCSRCGQVYTL